VDGPLDDSLSPASPPSAAGSEWDRREIGAMHSGPRMSGGSARSIKSGSPAAPIVAGAYVESPVGEDERGRGRD
jgi:hypothetical protein